MAIGGMVQRVNIVTKDENTNKPVIVRQTDCLEKRNGQWKVIHEHSSVPTETNWNGEIITE
jgi:ketosteroid isomerase-like protein